MSTDDLQREALEFCRHVLSELPSPIDDGRLPAPDVMGHLADRNIRRNDFKTITQYARKRWPTVLAIRCGVSGTRPYFSIQISPFSRESQHAHWPLADWIRSTWHLVDCDFFLLPPMDGNEFGAEVEIYRHSIVEEAKTIRRAA